MRLLRNKKGTDKPIEIFIALFVILAVAMVILKMFSGQINQKKEEMEMQAQKEKINQLKADLDVFCSKKCSDAHRSLKSSVNYCLSKYPDTVDLDGDNLADYTEELMPLQGFCEDAVYCAAYYDCGSLNIKNCKELVCRYMQQEMGMEDPEALADRLVGYDDGEYNGYYEPGKCWDDLTEEEKAMHWFNQVLLVEDILSEKGSGKKCSLLVGSCNYKWSDVNEEFAGVDGAWWEKNCPIFNE